jgi:hypothetical protein
VDALNRLARDRFALDGRLTGPDLTAPGGQDQRAEALRDRPHKFVELGQRGEALCVVNPR